MRYKRLAAAGLAALVMNSCKFEMSVGTPNIDGENVVKETYHKPVIYQESDVMPITIIDEALNTVKPEYKKVVLNLTRLYSSSEKEQLRGTALLVNPTQMLTAYHVTNSPNLEYVIRNSSGKDQNISSWIRNIDADDTADIAVVNLNVAVADRPSLQFYDKPISTGLPIALITYNNDRFVIREGEITKVYTVKGKEKFETNIAVIGGNSGGAYVDQSEGKIVGVITNGSPQLSLGPSIRTLDVEKKQRVLTVDEQKRIELYNETKEFVKREVNLGYDDFVRGDFYLKGDDVSVIQICLKPELLVQIEPRCFSRDDFPTIVATRVQKSIAEGRGELNSAIKFKDGRKYEFKTLFVPDSFDKNSLMSSTSISGEW